MKPLKELGPFDSGLTTSEAAKSVRASRYEPPQLVLFGSVATITSSSGSIGYDAAFGRMGPVPSTPSPPWRR